MLSGDAAPFWRSTVSWNASAPKSAHQSLSVVHRRIPVVVCPSEAGPPLPGRPGQRSRPGARRGAVGGPASGVPPGGLRVAVLARAARQQHRRGRWVVGGRVVAAVHEHDVAFGRGAFMPRTPFALLVAVHTRRAAARRRAVGGLAVGVAAGHRRVVLALSSGRVVERDRPAALSGRLAVGGGRFEDGAIGTTGRCAVTVAASGGRQHRQGCGEAG